MTPIRVQLSRKRGYRMPENTKSVTRPGRWGNPYRVEIFGLPLALELFERSMKGFWSPDGIPDAFIDAAYAAHERFHKILKSHPTECARSELRGLNLACTCDLPEPGEPDLCHRSILLRIANS